MLLPEILKAGSAEAIKEREATHPKPPVYRSISFAVYSPQKKRIAGGVGAGLSVLE